MTVERYRVVGTLISMVLPEYSGLGLTAGELIEVDLMLPSTDPRFAVHMAAWQATLGYVAWRWLTPPAVTRLEDE